eukprot:COSAG02_NODE_15375_length_1176_cov_1.565460_2_plen_91_part_00
MHAPAQSLSAEMLAFAARLQDTLSDDLTILLPPGKNEWLANPAAGAGAGEDHTGKISRMSRGLLKRSVSATRIIINAVESRFAFDAQLAQ